MDLALGSAMPIETGTVRWWSWQQGRVATATPQYTVDTGHTKSGMAPGGVRTPLE